ncbi:hypothetical protein RclHR1_03930005 [Rhizophagus clarus]|uniref:Uncharacterized protein n=1 Tax=Rhizophagus clarus TaxID=94130 RepID=A0A2Z6RR03_9GLOM|nr:hypothetical protein RclHR1_03930005 [Rhizophagus clarus]
MEIKLLEEKNELLRNEQVRFRPAHILDVTKIPGNRVYHYEEITNKFERRLEDSLESRQKIKVKITNASTGDQIAPNSQSLEPVETGAESSRDVIIFEDSRNSLLDKNSEGWLNCYILTSLVDDRWLHILSVRTHQEKNRGKEKIWA